MRAAMRQLITLLPSCPVSPCPSAGWIASRYFRNFAKLTGRFSTKAFRPSIASSVW